MSRPNENPPSIVGAWLINIKGAPFEPHVAIFHGDGTVLIHNPEFGDRETSDSLGVGAWTFDQEHPHTVIGRFVEVNADRESGHYVSRLEVPFTLTMQGADALSGSAKAAYFNPDGTQKNTPLLLCTLQGTRILP